jgi:hypothetical protein
MDDLTHLAICGGESRARFARWQKLAEVHSSGLIHRVAKRALAQRLRK